ncbi:MAG: hypothetical protein Q9213_005604 [Squamulea squamosa]
MSEQHGCLQQNADSGVFTLDPNAKYMTRKSPERPDPTSLPNRTLYADSVCSIPADFSHNRAHAGTSAPPPTARLQSSDCKPLRASQGLCIPFPTSSTLMAKLFKLRGSRFPPDVDQKLPSVRQRPFKSIWRRATDNDERRTFQRPSLPIQSQSELQSKTHWDSAESLSTVAQAVYVAPWIANSTIGLTKASDHPHSVARRSTIESKSQPASHLGLEEDISERMSMQRSSPGSRYSTANHCPASADINLAEHNACGAPATATIIASSADVYDSVRKASHEATLLRPEEPVELNTGNSRAGSPLSLPIQSNTIPEPALRREKASAGPSIRSKRSARPPSLLHDNMATLETFYTTNSFLDGQLSPQYLSQPESPSIRDFEEVWEWDSNSHGANSSVDYERPPIIAETVSSHEVDLLQPPQLPSPGLEGYMLPEAEQASTLTLHKLPSTVFSPVQEDSPKSNNNRFVQSWSDGSDPRRLTALDELVDDLGYLCNIIS